MKRYSTPAEYFDSRDKDKDGLLQLREIMLNCGLDETIKWGTPVYTLNNKNIVGLGSFKSYFGLWYFQGSFLRDEANKLINAQEGKTKAMRQLKFSSSEEIRKEELIPLIEQTLDNQDQGLFIKSEKKSSKIVLPPELKEALETDPGLKACFEALSPGKKREYAEHVGSAKREATRLSRLDKAIPLIRAGKGLNDRYKK